MTTAQESTNGHRVPPHPFSIENPDGAKPSDLPTNKANINSDPLESRISDLPSPGGAPAFPANAYHVPPTRYAPKPHSYRYDDTLGLPPETGPLPERCQFMFSDGRQCTMARSDIHPSLCHYHSEREDQLFGTPSSGGSVVGAGFDLPELYSACRDLTTAAGVNRALAQVFRLLAQRRISRQEAATFAKLGHLLLQTISTDPTRIGVPSEYHERGAQLASRRGLRGIPPEPVPDREMSPASLPPRDAVPAPQHQNGAPARQPVLSSLDSSAPLRPPAASSEELSAQTAAKNSFVMNTSAKAVCNSPEINTSEIARLKVAQNQHLHKNSGEEATFKSSSIKLGSRGSEGAERVPDNHENRRKT
jgi:hypothetical protein